MTNPPDPNQPPNPYGPPLGQGYPPPAQGYQPPGQAYPPPAQGGYPAPPAYGQPPAPGGAYYPAPGQGAPGRPIGRTQGAWGLWWLCLITFGIYYLVWYQRVNTELAAFTGVPVDASCKWWSQIIPIYSIVALVQTSGRVNAAHAAIGSPIRVGGFMTFLAACWYASQTRYLQRRINSLWEASGAPAA